MQIEVHFPKHYKPLPEGYKVIWSESCDHYLGINGDIESEIYCCRFMARKWCFASAQKKCKPVKKNVFHNIETNVVPNVNSNICCDVMSVVYKSI